MATSIKAGSYTGTGAVINVSVGFEPDFVLLFNATDGDVAAIWFNGMAAGTAGDIAAAVATNAADGITLYTGSTTAAPGFTVGTDYSESAKVFYYIAIESGPGAN